MPVQMRLIVESDRNRDVGGPHAVQQQATGPLEAPADQVPVRRHAELPRECPDKMGGMGVQDDARLIQSQAGIELRVEKVPQLTGQPLVRHPRRRGRNVVDKVLRGARMHA
jgi:hypothetical protein